MDYMDQMDLTKYSDLDYLTGLYNRMYYVYYAKQLIDQNIEFSVFNIDLNHFKTVNDVHGHDIGDMVLIEVGKRFKALQNEDIIFARFGGDELAALYKCVDVDKVNALGDKIRQSLSDRILVSESEFDIDASIGVARYPIDSDRLTHLLKLADMAMYSAKKAGDLNSRLISDKLNSRLHKNITMTEYLRKLDVDSDLFLEYQPIYDMSSDDIIGMEAFVRWNHKDAGIIYPNDFIKLAEEIDVVKDITKWVFINALNQIREWNLKYNQNWKMSLNVADACIHNKIFFGNVKFMLEAFKVKPEWLSIELSELSLSVLPEYMKNLLQSIHEHGIEIHLDNYGTTPSFIADLKTFNIDTIKIDKNYIHHLDDKNTANIVEAMIKMADVLGINVIAECVETQGQYDIIKDFNCGAYSGFYKCKPMRQEEFEEKFLSKYGE